MSAFYFSVGEEVILQSKTQPESNGNAVVVAIRDVGGEINCPTCGQLTRCGGNDLPGYYLNVLVKESCCQLWSQRALRKKHDPGQSFDSLMSSLNIKVN